MKQEELTLREQAVDTAVQEVKKRALSLFVFYKDVMEPHDILSYMTLAMVEIIELFANTTHQDAKEIAKDVCDGINKYLEI